MIWLVDDLQCPPMLTTNDCSYGLDWMDGWLMLVSPGWGIQAATNVVRYASSCGRDKAD